MMKVLKIKNIQNCRKLVIMCDVLLDRVITKSFIDHLSILGSCEYYSDFPKPFFKINLTSKDILKGAEGNDTLRISLLGSNSMEYLNSVIQNFTVHTESYID